MKLVKRFLAGLGFFAGALGATLALATTPEARGLELARDWDKANSGFVGERAELEMELVNAHGDVTRRKMRIMTMEGTDDGDRSKLEFSWPADVKGTRLLTWTHKSGGDDQWLYMPAVKRVKRISSQNKSGAFMGSEFSYEDLASQEVEKYTYRFIDEAAEAGRDCWRTERYPTDKGSGYTRQVVWTDKVYELPIRVDYYDRKNELLKTATFTGFEQYGQLWRWRSVEMRNHQTKKKSVLTWTKRELNVRFQAADFDQNSLED